MRTLYHLPISPLSRAIRIALAEKGLNVELVIEHPWEERESFIDLNPAGDLPVLVEPSNIVVADPIAIAEYLEEAYPEGTKLFPGNPYERAEIRRLVGWMSRKFQQEVMTQILHEKVMKSLHKTGWPDTKILRQANTSLTHHLTYFSWLLEERDWLSGYHYSFGDITVAAYLSVLDFLGCITWDKFPAVKEWYACIKSRPSFRPLLTDTFQGVRPPAHYINLDF